MAPSTCKQWQRFRLRTFLVLCLVAGAGLGIFGPYIAGVHGKWRITADLERQGCLVHSDFEKRFGLMPMQRKGSWKPLVEWALANPDELYLNLAKPRLMDNLLSQVADLGQARRLVLSATNVTDRGLAHLSRVNGLEEVWLFSTAITDNGLAHLVNLPKLKRIDLTDTKISDDGIQHLVKMSSLEEINLTRTQVSPAGVLALKQSLPRARIIRESFEDASSNKLFGIQTNIQTVTL